MRRLLIASMAVVLLSGCSGPTIVKSPDAPTETPLAVQPTPTVEPAPTEEPAADRTDVPWVDYAADLQPSVDAMQAAGDCVGLQSAFDASDANSGATQARTGHTNYALLAYIDEALKMADCY